MFEAVIESIIEEREEARKQGIALGHEQAHQEKLQIATNLKELGVPIETIIQATGLTIEEITEFQKQASTTLQA